MPHGGAHARRRSRHQTPATRIILAWVRRCLKRAAERRALAQLNDWQLKDIGISRADAEGEANKCWWRA
jgi:uncharacterized protein YjiS (DUF1127 family)